MKNNSIKPVNGSGLVGDPYILSEISHLGWLSEQTNESNTQGKYYKLENNIDATETALWDDGKGFCPIGRKNANGFDEFEGIFDGNGKVISNLTIARSNEYFIGLFGLIGNGGVVKNLGVENAKIIGIAFVGGLVGLSRGQSEVINCFSEAKVSGSNSFIGGLIGQNNGIVHKCYASGAASGEEYIGGLVGENKGSIEKCYTTSIVTGYKSVGGFVGGISGNVSRISSCYSTGDATGNETIGGLIGSCYDIDGRPTVSDSFSTGNVKAKDFAGSLIGSSRIGTISHCYALGKVFCSGLMCDGLLGHGGVAESCYWPFDLRSFSDIVDMVSQTTIKWNFDNIWLKGEVHPILKECGIDKLLFSEYFDKKRLQKIEEQKLNEQKRIQAIEEQKIVEQKKIQLEEEKKRLLEEKRIFIDSLKAKRFESKQCINCGKRLSFIERLFRITTHKKCTVFKS